MTDFEIDKNAHIIWDYMLLKEEPKKSDAILCLCSTETRVAERASELMNDGYGKFLIISGGVGKISKDNFSEPEAEVFKKIAIQKGVNPAKIILETDSTNTGENIRFSHKLLKDKGLKTTSLVIVQKPYMERRTFATFKKQWPDANTTITVTSPQISYTEYVAGGLPKDQVINIMVGDLQRIREYPKLGFQIEQQIPEPVWDAYQALVGAGFDKFVI
jgi:uncharacterized SAM-binding protein YcdF (DUF218 family)